MSVKEAYELNKDILTVEDCDTLYHRHGICVLCGDGEILGFGEE